MARCAFCRRKFGQHRWRHYNCCGGGRAWVPRTPLDCVHRTMNPSILPFGVHSSTSMLLYTYSRSSGSYPAQSAGTPCSVTAILPVVLLSYNSCCFRGRSVISNLQKYFMGFDREKTHACRWGFDRINLETGASPQRSNCIRSKSSVSTMRVAAVSRTALNSIAVFSTRQGRVRLQAPAVPLAFLHSVSGVTFQFRRLFCCVLTGCTSLTLRCPAAHSVK